MSREKKIPGESLSAKSWFRQEPASSGRGAFIGKVTPRDATQQSSQPLADGENRATSPFPVGIGENEGRSVA